MFDSPSATASIDTLVNLLNAFRSQASRLEESGKVLVDALRRGHKVLTCGNGGSAADALHMAEELVGRFRRNRRPLPGICLSADVTSLTCIANDFGYEHVFSRCVDALGAGGDVLVSFTTSGNSPNVVRAMVEARKKGLINILVTGRTGGKATSLADFAILVPSDDTARIQEVHTFVLHHWLEMIENEDWDQRD